MMFGFSAWSWRLLWGNGTCSWNALSTSHPNNYKLRSLDVPSQEISQTAGTLAARYQTTNTNQLLGYFKGQGEEKQFEPNNNAFNGCMDIFYDISGVPKNVCPIKS